MRLYNSGAPFYNYIAGLDERLLKEINTQSENYILNVNIDDYAEHLASNYSLDIPELHFDKVYVDSVERDIPASKFPRHDLFYIEEKYYKKEVIIYHLPYTGDIGILQYRPNPWNSSTIEVAVNNKLSCLLIEVINFYNDPEKIKQAYNQTLHIISGNYEHLRSNCNAYNNDLLFTAKQAIENRRKKLLAKNDLMSSLGVPIKKREDVSQTFSVPKPVLREKVIINKPVVKDATYKPEPTLDEDNYREILKIISDVGHNLERMPSTYKGKGEEDIRDNILIILDPQFELGSASGETFNKSGKTDICLRYDSSVVFIAECKYWKGEKAFLKTIDQLLGYLTWRNSKVAIINFVQNAEFTDVLNKVKSSITTHLNYLKHTGDQSDTWFNYKFHLNGDRNRELDLAVISFHLPK